MKKVLSVFAQVALFCLGVGLFAGSLWLLVRFFAYGDNHPVNIVLGAFGLEPLVPNATDIDWLHSSLLDIFLSFTTAGMIYLFLANLALFATSEASALIAAGGLKQYRSLKREPAKAPTGLTKVLLQIVNPQK